MNNFWKNLKKPITCLAPMDDVTDFVFREIICDIYRPSVFFTEFTNVEALCSKGYDSEIRRLKYSKKQKPIVAQLWGIKPENFLKSAKIVEELGFDGVDINMGCPQKDVVKNGSGSAIIENPNLAKEIISATKEGVKNVPVSVKTRIGFKKIITEEWITFLLQQDIAALTIHGRTQKEMSKVPCHWDEIEKSAKISKKLGLKTKIIGNGDIESYSQGLKLYEKAGLDGFMIGRGIFKNINIFDSKEKTYDSKQKMEILENHLNLWENTWGKEKNYNIMKKFIKIYINDYKGSKKHREMLMNTSSMKETLQKLHEIENL